MVFGLVSCSEVNNSNDQIINLSCSTSGVSFYSNDQVFKKYEYEDGYDFQMIINKNTGIIKAGPSYGHFSNLVTGEYAYTAIQYKMKEEDGMLVDTVRVRSSITVNRINLSFSIMEHDSYLEDIGGPKDQHSIASGSCMTKIKI